MKMKLSFTKRWFDSARLAEQMRKDKPNNHDVLFNWALQADVIAVLEYCGRL